MILKDKVNVHIIVMCITYYSKDSQGEQSMQYVLLFCQGGYDL